MLIQDDALRSVIARTLRVKEEELTEDLMKELIHLEVQDHEIATLEGLQYAENLETLNASNNKLQTLDPIRDLHNLVCLDVSRNQLRDLQALHGFRQLKKLNVSRNNLYTMDISSVAAMIDLEVLNLSKAKVDSLIYYIKKYPFSLAIILIVIYLSFFKPPRMDDIPLFPGVDKVVHFCMYGGMSGMLWLEFLRNHRKYETVLWHAWIGAVLCPIVMSGIIEILQEYCTTYRGGDWFDFLANTCGVIAATAFAWFVLRPWIVKDLNS